MNKNKKNNGSNKPMNPNGSMAMLKSLINSQALQAKINEQVFNAIQQQTKESKQELKAYTDKAINEIKKYIPMSDGEAAKLKQAISSRAAITTKSWLEHRFGDKEYGGNEFFSKKYGHIIRSFYSLTKHHFGAIKYTAILHTDFEEAVAFANQLNLYSLPKNTQRITEKQLETLNNWEERHHKPLTQPDD